MSKNIQNLALELLKDADLGSLVEIHPLAQSGSSRHYFRIFCDDGSFILCESDDVLENTTFISLDRYFLSQGIPVPHILAVNAEKSAYLLQDLGSVQLLDILRSDNSSTYVHGIINEVFDALSRMQFLPESGWRNKVGFGPLDGGLIRYDFTYSYSQFISRFRLKYDLGILNSEFQILESKLLSFPGNLWGFMFRDFQSRNVMVCDGRPLFIDFQSGRKGPCIYDFVSFVWQARAGFSSSQRMEMLRIYTDALKRRGLGDVYGLLAEYIPYFASFRLLQVLGAYGLRGLTERKPHFIESIPPALKEFQELLESSDLCREFPTLYSIVSQLRHLCKQTPPAEF